MRVRNNTRKQTAVPTSHILQKLGLTKAPFMITPWAIHKDLLNNCDHLLMAIKSHLV